MQHLILMCPAGIGKKPDDWQPPAVVRNPWTVRGQMFRCGEGGWREGGGRAGGRHWVVQVQPQSRLWMAMRAADIYHPPGTHLLAFPLDPAPLTSPAFQAGFAALELGRDAGQHRALLRPLGPRADLQVLPLALHAAATAE